MHFGRGHLPFSLYNVILSVKLYNNHLKRYQKLLKYCSRNIYPFFPPFPIE